MLVDRFVLAVVKRFRGKELKLAPGLSATSVLVNLFQKGFGAALRGLWMRLMLKRCGGHFFVGRGCRILNRGMLSVGRNVYLGAYGYFDCLSLHGVQLGNHVTIREGAWLQLTSRYDTPGEYVRIGNQVYIGPRVVLGAAAPLVIGDRCQIGANVSFIAENHAYEASGEIFEQGVKRVGIEIGTDVWIGNNVVVLDGVTIGDGCVVGAGAVVTRSVPPRSVIAGVPARVIKSR